MKKDKLLITAWIILIVSLSALAVLAFYLVSPYLFYTHTGIIGIINKERISRFIPPVRENKLLNKSAELKALDQINKNYWSHTSPDGSSYTIFFVKAEYKFNNAGEVLGKGYDNDAELVQAWMDSPTHKAVILDPRWREVGFSRKGIYTVMHFGQR